MGLANTRKQIHIQIYSSSQAPEQEKTSLQLYKAQTNALGKAEAMQNFRICLKVYGASK